MAGNLRGGDGSAHGGQWERSSYDCITTPTSAGVEYLTVLLLARSDTTETPALPPLSVPPVTVPHAKSKLGLTDSLCPAFGNWNLVYVGSGEWGTRGTALLGFPPAPLICPKPTEPGARI